MAYRQLTPEQRSQIWIGGPGMVQPELLFETGEVLIEAPNWSLDGASLFVNGRGLLGVSTSGRWNGAGPDRSRGSPGTEQ